MHTSKTLKKRAPNIGGFAEARPFMKRAFILPVFVHNFEFSPNVKKSPLAQPRGVAQHACFSLQFPIFAKNQNSATRAAPRRQNQPPRLVLTPRGCASGDLLYVFVAISIANYKLEQVGHARLGQHRYCRLLWGGSLHEAQLFDSFQTHVAT